MSGPTHAPRRPPRRTTIFDVAEHAGVSIKTVSRVINREANVKSETRRRVLDAADKLRYEPNPAARGLAGHRTFSIGLLYENPHEFSYVQQVLEGAYSVCDNHGYALLLRPSHESPEAADIRRFLTQTRVDGVVLTAPVCDRSDITDTLVELGIPFVRISPKSEDARHTSVAPDDFAGSHALTEHMLSLGHRRVAFIRGDPRHGATEKRLQGHIQCLREHGIRLDPDLVLSGRFDFESGRSAAQELLKLPLGPTAVIASNDDMAAGVIAAAHEAGVDLPHALSVAGFDDTPTALRTWPPLTTVRQPTAEIASRATELLLEWIRGERTEPILETFDCQLIVRPSTTEPASA